MKKKLTICMFVCLFNVVSSITYAQVNDAIQWISFEQLHDSLKVHPKKVFIDFYADWCAPCLKMDEIAFKDPKIIHKLNNDYYAVKMNVETTDTIFFGQQSFINKRANKRNPVHEIPLLLASRKDAPFTLPAMVLMDSKFNAQARYFQYLDAEQLLAILEKMP